MKIKRRLIVLSLAVFAVLIFSSAVFCEEVAVSSGESRFVDQDEWEEFIKEEYGQEILDKIAYRDTIDIPIFEVLQQKGMTYEEYKDLSREEVMPDEITESATAGKGRDRVQAQTRSSGFSDAWGTPSGSNSFDYYWALWGDILLVHDGDVPWGYFRHVGMFDTDQKENGLDPIIEADPTYGVHYASEEKFLGYDQQVGYKPIHGYGYNSYNALIESRTHLDKPYNYDIFNKTTTEEFYCSQLVWRSYYDVGWDLDTDGGNAVLPDDLTNMNYLRVWQTAD